MSDPQATRAGLTLAALGVVFGDIGTSPLYAMRECFLGVSGFPVDRPNILGILSLITWSLVLVVALQFILLVLRADNQGEGGLLALAHLCVPDDIEAWSPRHWFFVGIGLFGAALLFGDGIITPALSVLSAVEGLEVATPFFQPFVVPITVGILAALFAIQHRGTSSVGRAFGPMMVLWFGTLAGLGLNQIAQNPDVLWGLDPRHGLAFFMSHGWHGTAILGAVFLVVTGAEAMYADLGHFGRQPIQRAWFLCAFPALLLNYFGQGALLLDHPEHVDAVFYHLAPAWGVLPLVALATTATIIASQAVISGVFSLTAQAIQLQYFPRAVIRHASDLHRGQIYVPAANRMLLIGTLTLVIAFRSSGALADAYGIAVSLSMVITTVLLFVVMRDVWRWPTPIIVALTVPMLVVDLAFFTAIARKVLSGGWIPLCIAAVLVAVMSVWRRGRQLLMRHPAALLDRPRPDRPGTQVYLVRTADPLPLGIEEDVVVLHVDQCHRPYMRDTPHGRIVNDDGPVVIDACYGFMETPDVPLELARLDREHRLGLDLDQAQYVTIHEVFDGADTNAMPRWMQAFYGLLSARAPRVTTMYGIPEDQVLEVAPRIPLNPRSEEAK